MNYALSHFRTSNKAIRFLWWWPGIRPPVSSSGTRGISRPSSHGVRVWKKKSLKKRKGLFIGRLHALWLNLFAVCFVAAACFNTPCFRLTLVVFSLLLTVLCLMRFPPHNHNSWYTRFGVSPVVLYVLFGFFCCVFQFFNICRGGLFIFVFPPPLPSFLFSLDSLAPLFHVFSFLLSLSLLPSTAPSLTGSLCPC